MQYMEAPYSKGKSAVFLQSFGLSSMPRVYAVDDSNGFAGYIIWHLWGKVQDDIYEIGWVLCTDRWRCGYAQELTEALLQENHCAYVIECVLEQAATKKIAVRNGFRYPSGPFLK